MTGGHRPRRPSDTLLAITLASLVATAVGNTTASAVAQPSIQRDLGVPGADVAWIVFGYAAAFAVATAAYGALGRRFGASRALSWGAAVFGIGSLLAVVAPSIGILVLARVVQGFGAGAIPTLAIVLIARRHEGARRARAIGVQIAGVGVGHALGPLVGGLLVDAVGWRGAVALGALALPTIPVLRRERSSPEDTAALDLRGAALLALVIGSLVFVVNRGLRGEDVQLVAAVTVAGVLASVALVVHVVRRPEGLVPLSVVRDRTFLAVSAQGAVGQGGFLMVITALPLVFGASRNLVGVGLGLLLLPMALAVAITSPRHGLVSHHVGRPRTTALAIVGIATGGAAVAAVGPSAPLPLVSGLLVLAGVGFGLLNAPLVGEMTDRIRDARQAPALGLYNVVFFTGGSLGSALASVAAGSPGRDPAVGFLTVAMMAFVVLGAVALALAVPRRRLHTRRQPDVP